MELNIPIKVLKLLTVTVLCSVAFLKGFQPMNIFSNAFLDKRNDNNFITLPERSFVIKKSKLNPASIYDPISWMVTTHAQTFESFLIHTLNSDISTNSFK